MLHLKAIIMLICIVLMKINEGNNIQYFWMGVALFYLSSIVTTIAKK